VLFLDEPTSGLDSFTANEVMTVVKTLIRDGTTIAATIHSPSSMCYSLFDRVSCGVARGEKRGYVVEHGQVLGPVVAYMRSLVIMINKKNVKM
jgi:ABC-type multidrug transport system ATPase subunit